MDTAIAVDTHTYVNSRIEPPLEIGDRTAPRANSPEADLSL
jgi:hypothetical protein